MKNEVIGDLPVRLRPYSWPIIALALVAIQTLFLIAVKPGEDLGIYSNIFDIGYFLLLIIATGLAALNAVRSRHAIRLFWFFFALGCAGWALSEWSWIYYVALSSRTRPDFFASSCPLFLHTILMIAAVASRPHLASSRRRPYQTTLDFLVLLFFLVFVYAFLFSPFEYTADPLILRRFATLYFAENVLLLIILGTMFSRVATSWKSIYGHMLGASALYAMSSLLENFLHFSGNNSAGLHDVPYTVSTCWFVWICLIGRERAPKLAQTVQVDTVNPRYASTLAMIAVMAIPIVGLWELFRTDQPYPTRMVRLVIVFLALVFLAITVCMTEYFSKREFFSEAELVSTRLRMAMASGKSVGWEWDLASGRDYWFGDLRTIFGVDAETSYWSMEDFDHYLHPDDRQRISQAITDARVNHKPYEAEFRVITQDGVVRWVSARGAFHCAKGGSPERMLGIAVDITEHKHAEEALKISEEKFAKAFRESPMALTLTSLKDHRYLDVNETFQQITGWQREEVIGRTPFDLQIWVNPAEELEFVRRLQCKGSVRNLEVRFRCRDGTERLGLGSGELIEIDNELCLLSVVADISDRKRIEEKLHESEQRLRGVVDSAMDAILAVDEKQQIVLFNLAAETMFGCSAKNALGTPIDRFIPERFQTEHAATDRTMGLRSLSGVRSNGEKFPIEASISRVETEGKKLFTAIIRDMTERRRMEEAQRQSEERLRLAVQAGKMYAYEWDAATGTITRSPECRDILGHDQPLETDRREMLPQVHPDDRALFETVFTETTRDNPTSHVSYRFLRADGSVIWLEKRARAFFDDKGGLLRAIGVVVDITDRKQAELALRESEERFRRVVEHVSDALIVDDVAGQVVFANDRFLQLFGLERERLRDLKLEDFVAPEHRAEIRDRHTRRMRGEVVASHFEHQGVRTDGKRMWLEVDVVPITGHTGKLVGTQSTIRDITERNRAEQLLRESEERFRFVANSAPVMIWMSGPDKLCNYVNQPWLEFTGRPIEAELGNGWTEGVHPEDLKACLDEYTQAFDQRQPFNMQYRLRRYDGEYRWVLDTAVPRFEPDGSFAGYIGSCIDVTDRKLAEEALATMGRKLIEAHEEERTWIARELHDDINQRLALLAIDLEKWDSDLPEAASHLRFLAQHARKRLVDISKDVQSLSHRLHSSKLEYLGITAAANSYCKDLAAQHKVQVEFSHSDVPRSLSTEASLALFRVLQEALQNAVKHSHARDFRAELRGTRDEVFLTVSDKGMGFDQAEAMNRRGLGLISMRERLQLVSGSLAIESKPGHGTTVRARVPIKPDRDSMSLAG